MQYDRRTENHAACSGIFHGSCPSERHGISAVRTESSAFSEILKGFGALELAFDAFDTAKGCIALFTGMIDTMKFNKDVMRKSANNGFTNATDAADYLVKKGVPFRDAHGIVGRIVLYCIDKGIAIDDMSIDELKAISPVFEEDVFDAISMETCVSTRCTVGAPSKTSMDKVIAVYDEYMKSNWQDEV